MCGSKWRVMGIGRLASGRVDIGVGVSAVGALPVGVSRHICRSRRRQSVSMLEFERVSEDGRSLLRRSRRREYSTKIV